MPTCIIFNSLLFTVILHDGFFKSCYCARPDSLIKVMLHTRQRQIIWRKNKWRFQIPGNFVQAPKCQYCISKFIISHIKYIYSLCIR